MTTIRGTSLRIDATPDGMVTLLIPDVGEMQLTWVDACELAYGILEASAAAARMVGADLDTVKNVAATAARRASGRPGDGAS